MLRTWKSVENVYQCCTKCSNRLRSSAMQPDMPLLRITNPKNFRITSQIDQTPFAIYFNEVSLFRFGTPSIPLFSVA